MTEENPKSDFKVSLEKEASAKKKKTHKDNFEKPLNIDNLLKTEKPVFVKVKEDLVDRIVKFSALAAVILAFITVAFDYFQSKSQDVAFKSFQQKLDSTFNIQRENSKKQHEKTIETLVTQQELMKRQNDSTIQLLRIQADRLKAQNGIWKINQKNEIHTQRVKISPTITDYYLGNDTIRIRFNYTNNGQRVAMNIDCKIAIFKINSTNISPLIEEKASFTMNKIIPGNTVFWKINKSFPSIIGNSDIYVYSSLTYEDEMYQKKFVTSEFIRIFNRDKKTEYSFCPQTQIEFIEKCSKFKDFEIEDFTIKKDKFFK
jgi:hypothetical protein